jgi:hypothetical protein
MAFDLRGRRKIATAIMLCLICVTALVTFVLSR